MFIKKLNGSWRDDPRALPSSPGIALCMPFAGPDPFRSCRAACLRAGLVGPARCLHVIVSASDPTRIHSILISWLDGHESNRLCWPRRRRRRQRLTTATMSTEEATDTGKEGSPEALAAARAGFRGPSCPPRVRWPARTPQVLPFAGALAAQGAACAGLLMYAGCSELASVAHIHTRASSAS